MDVKFKKGDTVVVSEDYVERVDGRSERAKGEITGVSTGVNDSRDEPHYSIDFENGGHAGVDESDILGYEGQFDV